jgi:hypothetical protein
MKKLLLIIFLNLLTTVAISGPPEPMAPPEPPNASELPDIKSLEKSLDTLTALKDLDKNLSKMDQQFSKYDELIRNLSDSIDIRNLTIGNDSITIVLDNDSILKFYTGKDGTTHISGQDNSRVNVGSKIIIDEDKVIEGNLVNIGADVIVRGTVNGSVWTIGGNIYVASTGIIRDSAISFSGKLKQEPGSRIGSVQIALNEGRPGPDKAESNPYRVMAVIFLITFFIWLILSATFTSLFKNNVDRVANSIKKNPWKSFFLGYLVYVMILPVFIVLCISILGIPLALVGLPVAVFAAMVLSATAISNLVGQRVINAPSSSFKAFFYGNIVMSGLPGLFFLLQLLTGSMVLMIFSFLFIGILILIIIPFGLGAIFVTRFGTREGKPVAPTTVKATAAALTILR